MKKAIRVENWGVSSSAVLHQMLGKLYRLQLELQGYLMHLSLTLQELNNRKPYYCLILAIQSPNGKELDWVVVSIPVLQQFHFKMTLP